MASSQDLQRMDAALTEIESGITSMYDAWRQAQIDGGPSLNYMAIYRLQCNAREMRSELSGLMPKPIPNVNDHFVNH